ncbi:MAG: MATE family efflux transporter [Treponema sp.]|nr:MATE family efflux transporter [Treponema sp.]
MKRYSVIKLAWPIFLQMLLSMALGYADTVMISRYSDVAVGALGNANQIMGFLTLAFTIVSSATGVVVAQYLGAKKTDQMDTIYTVAVAFNLVLSVVVCTVVTVFSQQLLRVMHVPEVMFYQANSYMKIVGLFLFTGAVTNTFSRIFNCNGNTVIGLVIMFGINLMNIGGNYVFLYGPLSFLNLGVSGVAVSTTISSIFGMISSFVMFRIFVKGRISLRLLMPFPKDILAKLLKLGIPSAGENISYNIAQILITVFVNTMGAVSITTKIYCNILCGFSIIFSNSVAGASAIITGHNVGSGDYDYAYRRVWKSLLIAMIVSVIISGANFLLSPFTLHLFTQNEEIIRLGHKIMFIAFILEFGRCVNLVVIQSMRAAGDVVFPTLLGIGSMWGISVVFAWILGIWFKLGLPGVWIAMASDEIFRAIVVACRWKIGLWRGRSVVN